MEQNQRPHSCDECRRYAGILNVRPDSWYIISAIAQLERDLIAERVRNGLAAAKARGQRIGRVRTRNSALIESLLEAGLSFREVAKVAKCSHGSVSAQKKEWLARKASAKANEPAPQILLLAGVTKELEARLVEPIAEDDLGEGDLGTEDGTQDGQETRSNCEDSERGV